MKVKRCAINKDGLLLILSMEEDVRPAANRAANNTKISTANVIARARQHYRHSSQADELQVLLHTVYCQNNNKLLQNLLPPSAVRSQ